MGQIKPIETRYKGYRFRSRLEARWAVFLDTLGVPWEYEKEGYELGNGIRYLPDFWLPDNGVFLEIKPGAFPINDGDGFADRAYSLTFGTGYPLLAAIGAPGDALIHWYQTREVRQVPASMPFVAFDYDVKHELLTVWSAEHEPIYEEPIADPWGRLHYFHSYSGGFNANKYLVCHPGHPALDTRRTGELPPGFWGPDAEITGPEDLDRVLSDRAKAAIQAARSARFEFGESGAG